MDPAKYADLFLDESREHLTVINNQLLVLEAQPDSADSVDAIFRAVHNLKGMSATMGFDHVARLSHAIENVLDVVRGAEDPPDQDLLQLLFHSVDRLERTIDDAVSQRDSSGVDEAISALDAFTRQYQIEPEHVPPQTPGGQPVQHVQPVQPVRGTHRVEVRIRQDALLRGARAALVLQRVSAIGNVTSVSPPLASMENQTFDGRFTFGLETDLATAAVEELIEQTGDVESAKVSEGSETGAGAHGAGARHVRVDLRRLDAIMNLVGELTTARSRLSDLADGADTALATVSRKITHLVGVLQDEVIQARMAPVSQIFDRFPRGVRDAARNHGKQVDLAIEGREIELDRAILDELSDPLLHLLRNAVDHGIEPPGERIAVGKPASGRITLSAHRERSMIVIRVKDDGRGIDSARIVEKAKAREIAGLDADNLRNDELLGLLAKPGFSTASSVSDLSGRGVGIDVVMTRLRSFGGSLDMTTEVGRGTTFILRLPPTLAILPALVAEVGQERFALPLTHVAETVDLDERSTTRVGDRDQLTVRDGTVPLSRLRDLMVIEGPGPAKQPVIIVQIGERRTGLVVDRVVGQRDIVARTVEMPLGTVPYFGGATVLGDGQPVLILDAARIV